MVEKRPSLLKAIALGSSMATTIAGLVGGGFLLGRYLDRYWGTQPWLQLLFMLTGLVAGGINLVFTLKKFGTSKDEK